MNEDNGFNGFKDEVKVLLSGYIKSEDIRNYLATSISRLHDEYAERGESL